jgi:hypothetical protein
MKENLFNQKQFFFTGEFKTKIFRKPDRTKILIDNELLWLRGFKDQNRLNKKLIDIRMKRTDVDSVDVVTEGERRVLKITGIDYTTNHLVSLSVPYLKDTGKALSLITEAIEQSKELQRERYREIISMKSNRR